MSQEEELDRPQVNEEQSRQGCDAAEALGCVLPVMEGTGGLEPIWLQQKVERQGD